MTQKLESLLTPKIKHTYGIAAKYLHIIGKHPHMVVRGKIGYFLTIENIKEMVGSLDPVDWYKDQKFENESISFQDLEVADQLKLKEVLENLVAPLLTQQQLENKCLRCGHLCSEFDDKIMSFKDPVES